MFCLLFVVAVIEYSAFDVLVVGAKFGIEFSCMLERVAPLTPARTGSSSLLFLFARLLLLQQ